jgi:TetR/AcrR family transcriptional regulator
MARKGTGREAEDGSVRRRLLDGAADLFARKGYAGTTVREIVAAARVTKPALYYYFGNKEGIYLELMKEAYTELDELLIASVEEEETASRKLLRLCDRAYTLFMENIKTARIMYAIYYGPPQGAPFFDFDAYHYKFQETVQRLIREGMRDGEFRKGDCEEMSWAVIGALNVALEIHLGHPDQQLGRDGLSRVLKIIFQGIAAEKGKRK